ncbi:MAG: Flp pilus assembly complex ATPase component TadA, partial [Gammaproteobacteria bacterium]|nr:Flp pilus assembly complex ATPase component TadA [Gammaproteobacteria bacterium]
MSQARKPPSAPASPSARPGAGATGRDQPLRLLQVVDGLRRDGVIDERQAARLVYLGEQQSEQTLAERSAIELVAEQGMRRADSNEPLDLESLTRWLAERARLPYERIDPLKLDLAAVTGIIKHAYAERFNILPIKVNGKRVRIATAEPWLREWETELGRTLGLEIERVVANPATLRRYITEFYAVGRSLKGAERDRRSAPVDTIRNFEALVDLSAVGEPDADDQHVVRIVDWLMQYAFEQRASDIHLEPRRETGNIRFRIDGVLHLVNEIPTPVLGAVVSRIKALGRLDVVEKRRPQDGRLKTRSPAGAEVELRLSTMPTTFGEKLVMRIFDPTKLTHSLAELGLRGRDGRLYKQLISQPYGMVIVTGPTGSGKTTTL